jgi:hypothetical protein
VVPPDDIDAHGDSDDEDCDLYAIVGDSNNGAYRQVEQRTGPPLAYVAEKTRHAIEAIHAVFWSIGDESGDRASAQAAFHYSVVSYLALHNMLAQVADHAAIPRLLAMSPQDLSRWLDVIAAEGSVTG